MSKHTPGPWEVSDKDQMRVNVKRGTLLHPSEPRIATAKDLAAYGDDCHDDWNICQCDDEYFMRDPNECEANARLIASAPDLLAENARLRAANEKAIGILRTGLTDGRAWSVAMDEAIAALAAG